MQRGNPEVTWNIDPVAAARFGLTVAAGRRRSWRRHWLGEVATDLRLLDRRVPVRVRLPDAVRFDPARLPQTLISTADGQLVPLSSSGEHEPRERAVRAAAREPARRWRS